MNTPPNLAIKVNGMAWQPPQALAGVEVSLEAPEVAQFDGRLFLISHPGGASASCTVHATTLSNAPSITLTTIKGLSEKTGQTPAAAVFRRQLWALYGVSDAVHCCRYPAAQSGSAEFETTGTPFVPTDGTTAAGRICAASYRGRIWVFYRDDQSRIRYAAARDIADTNPLAGTTGYTSAQPVSAVEYRDRLYLAFQEPASTVAVLAWHASGSPWSRPISIFDTADPDAHPTLTVVGGLLHLTVRGIDGFIQERIFDGNAFGPISAGSTAAGRDTTSAVLRTNGPFSTCALTDRNATVLSYRP